MQMKVNFGHPKWLLVTISKQMQTLILWLKWGKMKAKVIS
jgi:hypothetical protein